MKEKLIMLRDEINLTRLNHGADCELCQELEKWLFDIDDMLLDEESEVTTTDNHVSDYNRTEVQAIKEKTNE